LLRTEQPIDAFVALRVSGGMKDFRYGRPSRRSRSGPQKCCFSREEKLMSADDDHQSTDTKFVMIPIISDHQRSSAVSSESSWLSGSPKK
jgi:hypothetical protein